MSESHEAFRTPIAPYLYYEDAGAAMDWLVRVFGFTEIVRMENPDGRVGHGELRLGNGVVMLGEPGSGYENPNAHGGRSTSGVHVYVEDVDAHHERAKAEGATINTPPTDQEYGDRRYDAEDLEGHDWFFAQSLS